MLYRLGSTTVHVVPARIMYTTVHVVPARIMYTTVHVVPAGIMQLLEFLDTALIHFNTTSGTIKVI